MAQVHIVMSEYISMGLLYIYMRKVGGSWQLRAGTLSSWRASKWVSLVCLIYLVTRGSALARPPGAVFGRMVTPVIPTTVEIFAAFLKQARALCVKLCAGVLWLLPAPLWGVPMKVFLRALLGQLAEVCPMLSHMLHTSRKPSVYGSVSSRDQVQLPVAVQPIILLACC